MVYKKLVEQLHSVNEKYCLVSEVNGLSLRIERLDFYEYEIEKTYSLIIFDEDCKIIEQYYFDDVHELKDVHILGTAAIKTEFVFMITSLEDEYSDFLH